MMFIAFHSDLACPFPLAEGEVYWDESSSPIISSNLLGYSPAAIHQLGNFATWWLPKIILSNPVLHNIKELSDISSFPQTELYKGSVGIHSLIMVPLLKFATTVTLTINNEGNIYLATFKN